MNKSMKLFIGAVFIGMIFFICGCNSSTTYYGGYYDPYPAWGYRSVRHYHYRPGRPHRPGHPNQPRPPRPTPRPSPRPTPRAR